MGLNIGIVGTRGIPNYYGGFEQVASYLSAQLVDRGNAVTVYSPHNHPYREDTWKGVRIIRCYDPPLGTAGQFVYDLICLLDARKRNFDVLLLLGYTSSSVWGRWYPKGPVIINNMDGLEWKRSKYSLPVRSFLKYAERLAVRFSDYYIADSTAIRDYLQWQYGIESTYIPYGAEIISEEDNKILKTWGLSRDQYYMIVARMEPENNIEMVIEGFLLSGTGKKMLVVGDTGNEYGKHLQERFAGQAHVVFTGPIFDRVGLHTLKTCASLYFHGHSVGGTNPSLLEAMASRAPNTDFTSAPLQLSPHPTSPVSVVALTITSVTPSRFTSELTSRCVYGTLTGMNSSFVIFIVDRLSRRQTSLDFDLNQY